MSLSRSWQFIGNVDGWAYRAYDALRRRVNARLVRFLGSHLTRARRCRVLEAGSGPGFATSLLRRDPRVTLAVCLDIDSDALRTARQRDPSLSAVRADLRRMPFADGTLDLVFNSSTIEHLDDPAGAIQEMQRACRNGGALFVGVPYRFGPLGFQPLIRRTRLGIWLGPVFSRSALDRMLRAAGLTPVARLRYFCNCFVGVVARKTPHCAANAPAAPRRRAAGIAERVHARPRRTVARPPGANAELRQ